MWLAQVLMPALVANLLMMIMISRKLIAMVVKLQHNILNGVLMRECGNY